MVQVKLKRVFTIGLVLFLCNVGYSQISDERVVYLPIYEPTEKGVEILNKVLDSKHPDLPKKYDGIFRVELYKNNILKINFDRRGVLNVLNQESWRRYEGCIFYRNKLFLLYAPEEDLFDRNVLFFKTKNLISFILGHLFIEQFEPVWNFRQTEDRFILSSIQFPTGLLQKEVDLDEFNH